MTLSVEELGIKLIDYGRGSIQMNILPVEVVLGIVVVEADLGIVGPGVVVLNKIIDGMVGVSLLRRV